VTATTNTGIVRNKRLFNAGWTIVSHPECPDGNKPVFNPETPNREAPSHVLQY
jgi:hypothetical protein